MTVIAFWFKFPSNLFLSVQLVICHISLSDLVPLIEAEWRIYASVN